MRQRPVAARQRAEAAQRLREGAAFFWQMLQQATTAAELSASGALSIQLSVTLV